jgi:hypothetical protein
VGTDITSSPYAIPAAQKRKVDTWRARGGRVSGNAIERDGGFGGSGWVEEEEKGRRRERKGKRENEGRERRLYV